ncbi:MAG: rod shape-determining protein RodA [Candidatus Paceibacterota bacterium]
MISQIRNRLQHIDWILLSAIIPIMIGGLVTMRSFTGGTDFYTQQILWICISLAVFFIAALGSYRFLRRQAVVITIFLLIILSLILVVLTGVIAGGAQSWFDLGSFRVQPAEPAKLAIIIVLAKYFDRRHALIHNFRHIIVSGIYTLLVVGLVFIQPDFGSAIIIVAIWFGIILVAGISLRHIGIILFIASIAFMLLWTVGLTDVQKERVTSFINPVADLQGAGYNARQAMVAVGSGEMFGKGVGYGTQSRLEFLPEYETDFIFAAFAEEWGFVGVLILISLFGIIFWRIANMALAGETQFERLFGAGVFIFLLTHFVIHTGINLGLLPVTGTTLPFMSYGGSHLLIEFLSIGILNGMQQYRRRAELSFLFRDV